MRLSIVGTIVVLAGVYAAFAQDLTKEPPQTGLKAANNAGQPAMQENGPRMADPMGQPKQDWWSERDAGLIGGIYGVTVGLLGGLIGILAGFGKARRFVLTLRASLLGLGVISLITGVIALAIGQPYAVYYPLLLVGIVLTAVLGSTWPILRRGYEQRELQRMAAMDAGLVNSRPKEKL